MNSYVQALYMTQEFRYRVLRIDLKEVIQSTNNQTPEKSEELKDNNGNTINKDADKLHPMIQSQQKITKIGTVFQLQKLFALLFKSKRESVCPKFFKSILPDQFRLSMAQHDTSEFGRMFLDQLERSVKNTNDKTLLDDYFIGQYRNSITCQVCGKSSFNQEKFLDISIGFSEVHADEEDLIDLVDNHFKSEMFEGDNKYECQFCEKRQDAKKETRVTNMPKYVIVTLNRFQYDLKTYKKIKLMRKVKNLQKINFQNYILKEEQHEIEVKNPNFCPDIEQQLEQNPETEKKEREFEEEEEKVEVQTEKVEDPSSQMEVEKQLQKEEKLESKDDYELYAMIVHRGKSAEVGHYFTYAKYQPDKWLLFDDATISKEQNFEAILNTFSSPQSTSTPYLLFYQQCSHASKLEKEQPDANFKLSNRMMESVENDEIQMMKEMDNTNKLASFYNFLKNQPSSSWQSQNYKKPNGDNDTDQGAGGSFGGFGSGMGGNGPIF